MADARKPAVGQEVLHLPAASTRQRDMRHGQHDMVAEATHLGLGDRHGAVVRLGERAEHTPDAKRHTARDAPGHDGSPPRIEAAAGVVLHERPADEPAPARQTHEARRRAAAAQRRAETNDAAEARRNLPLEHRPDQHAT
jgi:hypothetical protein